MEKDVRWRTVILVLVTVVVAAALAWVFRVKTAPHPPADPQAAPRAETAPPPKKAPQWQAADGSVVRVKASFYFAEDHPDRAFDGVVSYDQVGHRNRWATWESGYRQDWLAWEFDGERRIEELTVHFFDDGGGTRVPASFLLEVLRDEEWVEVPVARREPEQPAAGQPNQLVVEPVTGTTFRVVVEHKPDHYSAITEIEFPQAEGSRGNPEPTS